jgi:ATP/maltotriose-dependent transcriptional regulator MalT
METTVPPYGVAIHQAIAGGDLDRMRALVTQTEDYLRNTGDVSAALELLKAEVARAEARRS